MVEGVGLRVGGLKFHAGNNLKFHLWNRRKSGGGDIALVKRKGSNFSLRLANGETKRM